MGPHYGQLALGPCRLAVFKLRGHLKPRILRGSLYTPHRPPAMNVRLFPPDHGHPHSQSSLVRPGSSAAIAIHGPGLAYIRFHISPVHQLSRAFRLLQHLQENSRHPYHLHSHTATDVYPLLRKARISSAVNVA